jgi:hypothetical protein
MRSLALRVLLGTVLATLTLAVVSEAAPREGAGRAKLPAPREKRLDRVLTRICAAATCRGAKGASLDASIHIWRDKRGRARLLEYRGSYSACSHPPINYYDVTGKLLLADGTGPREPEEWNRPELKRIHDMQLDLHEDDGIVCK